MNALNGLQGNVLQTLGMTQVVVPAADIARWPGRSSSAGGASAAQGGYLCGRYD